jgi:PTS system ascorbate-specific IIA component
MAGILVIAHRPLASALIEAARHVYSRCGTLAVRALDIEPDADVAGAVERARALRDEVDTGQGVIVLSDVFGATPANVAAHLVEPGRTAVLAGVSLPMLLRALCYCDAPLADLVAKALAGGTQGIMQVAPTPVQNQGSSPQGNDDLARLHHQQ